MQLSESQYEHLTALIQPTLDELGIELVDLVLKQENGNTIFDVVIDKGGDLTLDNCTAVSKKISLILDVDDPFSFEYYLEVGSPGIYRELCKDTDFLRFANKRVKAVFHNSYKGRKQFVGILKEYHPPSITMEGTKGSLTVELEYIKKVHLFPEF